MQNPMAGHDVIVVGASAGGVEALMKLVSGFPADLPAAVFVVLHLPPESVSMLPHILSRAGALPAQNPVDFQPIEQGRIYVAPADYHLLIEPGLMRVTRGPRENNHRPAIDPLFRTAAVAYGPRVVGVVLTGTLDDGTEGLLVVKEQGGIAICQDPDEALFPGMPRSALEHVDVDYVLPLDKIAPTLVRLAGAPLPTAPASDEDEVDPVELQEEAEPVGQPSVFTCPICHGTLFRHEQGELRHFVCRVGHAFSPESLAAGQEEELEAALWAALRALEERAQLASQLSTRAAERGLSHAQGRFAAQADEARRRAALVQRVLIRDGEVREEGA